MSKNTVRTNRLSSAKYCLIKGATLVEIMIALCISILLLSSLISVYLATQSINQMQLALITIMENSTVAFNFLRSDLKTEDEKQIRPYHDAAMKLGSMAFLVDHIKTNEMNYYFIGQTKRKTKQGGSIYALYRLDNKHPKTELVEGVNDMQIQYTILENNQMLNVNEKEIPPGAKIIGISLMLTFTSLNALSLQKSEYMYVSL